jgi:hypothetical protein
MVHDRLQKKKKTGLETGSATLKSNLATGQVLPGSLSSLFHVEKGNLAGISYNCSMY